LSRHFERQCDRYALDRTGQPEAYRAAFCKLARLNKADPDPHPFIVWLLYDHPPIRERLAMASGQVPTGSVQ
jgi:STE24 endopeptidase